MAPENAVQTSPETPVKHANPRAAGTKEALTPEQDLPSPDSIISVYSNGSSTFSKKSEKIFDSSPVLYPQPPTSPSTPPDYLSDETRKRRNSGSPSPLSGRFGTRQIGRRVATKGDLSLESADAVPDSEGNASLQTASLMQIDSTETPDVPRLPGEHVLNDQIHTSRTLGHEQSFHHATSLASTTEQVIDPHTYEVDQNASQPGESANELSEQSVNEIAKDTTKSRKKGGTNNESSDNAVLPYRLRSHRPREPEPISKAFKDMNLPSREPIDASSNSKSEARLETTQNRSTGIAKPSATRKERAAKRKKETKKGQGEIQKEVGETQEGDEETPRGEEETQKVKEQLQSGQEETQQGSRNSDSEKNRPSPENQTLLHTDPTPNVPNDRFTPYEQVDLTPCDIKQLLLKIIREGPKTTGVSRTPKVSVANSPRAKPPSIELETKEFGYIYIYRSPDDAGYVKIGCTGRLVKTRLDEWSKCELRIEPVPDPDQKPVRHFAFVERLIKGELAISRKYFKCGKCKSSSKSVQYKSHQEWFKISDEEALATVKKWRTWIVDCKPYDEYGQLTGFWLQKYNFLVDNFDKVDVNDWLKPPTAEEKMAYFLEGCLDGTVHFFRQLDHIGEVWLDICTRLCSLCLMVLRAIWVLGVVYFIGDRIDFTFGAVVFLLLVKRGWKETLTMIRSR